ncbi:hypothetical protein CEUSTIGMA_g8004.t1 [Chlamydomonas eustigma]|uniref:Methyltransferase FkbM domain-containing protein n=1 Tax=Chlamydomonas eustigma TaxID=1157962 RepID=A0A250XBV3_9CHLO|nr:hypothetical protein CEUSTIGMA_g8004.t1 [Chlamydomonas eustigma]|eukprot:GAX80567.1 hypothetical protein CEUSTIGMA_g8004.t1 [Chlamydomonas eustigma]
MRLNQFLLYGVLIACTLAQIYLFSIHLTDKDSHAELPKSIALTPLSNETYIAQLRQRLFCEDAPPMAKKGVQRVTLSHLPGSPVMFTYKDHDFVSESIINHDTWEQEHVNELLWAMKQAVPYLKPLPKPPPPAGLFTIFSSRSSPKHEAPSANGGGIVGFKRVSMKEEGSRTIYDAQRRSSGRSLKASAYSGGLYTDDGDEVPHQHDDAKGSEHQAKYTSSDDSSANRRVLSLGKGSPVPMLDTISGLKGAVPSSQLRSLEQKHSYGTASASNGESSEASDEVNAIGVNKGSSVHTVQKFDDTISEAPKQSSSALKSSQASKLAKQSEAWAKEWEEEEAYYNGQNEKDSFLSDLEQAMDGGVGEGDSLGGGGSSWGYGAVKSWSEEDRKSWPVIDLKAGSDLFVDIGANVGWFTLNLAAYGFHVASFEGLHSNLNLLRSSLCENVGVMNRVTLYPFGLGDKQAICYLYSKDENLGNGNADCESPSKEAAAAALPSDLKIRGSMRIERLDTVHHNKDIKAIKIDTEGYEVLILRGAWHLFRRVTVWYMLLEFNYEPTVRALGGGNPKAFLKLIKRLGFRFSEKSFRGPFINSTDDGQLDALVKMSKLRGLINLFCVNDKFFTLQPAEQALADRGSYRSGREILSANGVYGLN